MRKDEIDSLQVRNELLKIDLKSYRILFVFTMIMLLVFVFIFVYKQNQMISEKDIGCYIYHVQECLDAHSKNLTLALCSGFYFEPREEDKEMFCAIHPEEDCWSSVPKECLT